MHLHIHGHERKGAEIRRRRSGEREKREGERREGERRKEREVTCQRREWGWRGRLDVDAEEGGWVDRLVVSVCGMRVRLYPSRQAQAACDLIEVEVKMRGRKLASER